MQLLAKKHSKFRQGTQQISLQTSQSPQDMHTERKDNKLKQNINVSLG